MSPALHGWLLAAGCWLLAAGCWQKLKRCNPKAATHKQQV